MQISAVNSDVSANASGIYEESTGLRVGAIRMQSPAIKVRVGPGKYGLGVQAMGWMLQLRSLVGEGWRV